MAKSKIFDYEDPMQVRSPKERTFMETVHDVIATHATTTSTTTTTTSTTTTTTA